MTRYQYQLPIIFKCIICIVMIGCSQSNNTTSSEAIDSISLNQGTQNYNIYVNNTIIGTSSIKITNGILITINGTSYSQVTELEETTSIDASSSTNTIYIKKLADGYAFLSEKNNELTTKTIPFPITKGASMYGPFSAISSSNMTLEIVEIHSTYTNKSGAIFNNVIQAQNSDHTIQVFFNEEYYIIQKEDYRYYPTIQSIAF